MKFRIVVVNDTYDPIGKMYHRHYEIERCINILGKENWFVVKQTLGDEHLTFTEPVVFNSVEEARRYIEDMYGKPKEVRRVIEIIDTRYEK